MLKTILISATIILAVAATLGLAIGWFAGAVWGAGVGAAVAIVLGGFCWLAATQLNIQ